MPHTVARPASSILLLALVLLAASGCRYGQASFDGTLGERAFDPGGTVFGYVDERDDNLLDRDPAPVVVAMTWLTFNPASDLNDLEGSELEDWRHELRLRDAVGIVFSDMDDVVPNADFTFESVGGTVLSDGSMSARIHLAPERLSATSSYDAFKPFGSRRLVSVGLETARLLEDGPELSGSIVVEVQAADTDPEGVLTGRVEGRFYAPLVSERIAERNLSLLAAGDVLGLPLPAEVTP
jgi:hypothetical protein